MAARLALVVVLAIAGCTSGPIPSPHASLSSAPARTDSPVPATVHEARFTATGNGSCMISNFGGCRPILLLSASSDEDFSGWIAADHDHAFETVNPAFDRADLTGPMETSPLALAAGPWSVGLGVRYNSDVAEEGFQSVVHCTRSFEVGSTTMDVHIDAYFERECRIEISLDGIPLAPLN